ncbi:hypothetical protein MK292_10515 [Myxococcota bacterium]|nr:hypothetical protein [Myxococcota bacterium]
MRKPHATKQDYELAFKGFHYPMSRAAILNMGRDKGGIDREVASILGLIPNSSYKNENEIREAVRNVYRSRGIQDEDLQL